MYQRVTHFYNGRISHPLSDSTSNALFINKEHNNAQCGCRIFFCEGVRNPASLVSKLGADNS